ncbi:CAP domain-containing protein [Bradyrhizobium sp. AZCC 1693]|uniref:CAP domain-containing protein n=1 Tax=Bradyrhizobium sp. AZCC 1693 TaxID=3117029 RepID=UPI002FEE9E50
MQLFGLRKTPDLSLAPRQALKAFERERAQIQRRAVGLSRPFAYSGRFCGHKKRVTLDAALTRIAHDQAQAMAAKDQLDHDVLGRFNSRVSPAGAGRAAENIAYGYDGFPKTLDQWINSSGHRKNLLLPGATRVGVASVKSAKTGRMYWAMVIAGDYERPKKPKGSPKSSPKDSKQATAARPKARATESCRLKILSLCL